MAQLEGCQAKGSTAPRKAEQAPLPQHPQTGTQLLSWLLTNVINVHLIEITLRWKPWFFCSSSGQSIAELLSCSVVFLSKQSHFCYNWGNQTMFCLKLVQICLPVMGQHHTVVLFCFPLVFQCRQGTTVCLTFPSNWKMSWWFLIVANKLLFLAWTFTVSQLSMKYWSYRIHPSRLKWICCVLVQLMISLEMQKWSSSRDLLNMTIVHFGVLSPVFCHLAVCILPSTIHALHFHFFRSIQLNFAC